MASVFNGEAAAALSGTAAGDDDGDEDGDDDWGACGGFGGGDAAAAAGGISGVGAAAGAVCGGAAISLRAAAAAACCAVFGVWLKALCGVKTAALGKTASAIIKATIRYFNFPDTPVMATQRRRHANQLCAANLAKVQPTPPVIPCAPDKRDKLSYPPPWQTPRSVR